MEMMEAIRFDLAAYEHECRTVIRRTALRSFMLGPCINVLNVEIAPLFPEVGDIQPGGANFPALVPLMYRTDLDDPNMAEELHRLEQVALASFPAALIAWRRSLGIQLYDHVAAQHMGNQLGLDASLSDEHKLHWLGLATTVFKCDKPFWCPTRNKSLHPNIYRFPSVLSHGCQREIGEDILLSQPWSPRGLVFDDRRALIIQDLVIAAGLDPSTATAADMDEADPRVVCLSKACPEPKAMIWWDCVRYVHTRVLWCLRLTGAVTDHSLPRALQGEVLPSRPLTRGPRTANRSSSPGGAAHVLEVHPWLPGGWGMTNPRGGRIARKRSPVSSER